MKTKKIRATDFHVGETVILTRAVQCYAIGQIGEIEKVIKSRNVLRVRLESGMKQGETYDVDAGNADKTDLVASYEGIVYTCQHRVEFSYFRFDPRVLTDDDKEVLKEAAEERAHELICDGYHSGELCHVLDGEVEIRGWWNIER